MVRLPQTLELMKECLLKSPHDGSTLTLAVTRRSHGETDFDVIVETPMFTGRAEASTFHNGPPVAMFKTMAECWRGWEGEEQWEDLEARVKFSATSDSTGHVKLRVDLRGHDSDSFMRVVVQFEAGQLESIAADVEGLFEAAA